LALEPAVRVQPGPQHHVVHLAATKASFEQASVDLRVALDACQVRGRARHHAELVFEEVVTNVIRHGDAGSINVSLVCETQASAIVLTFDDDGRSFDPLQRPMPVLPKSLEEAPLGGLGLLLVRKASTHLHYERTTDQKNRLTVTIPAA
jgi:anti-sigma regulatory factor (Ser/Thr protein kinase)